MASRSLSNHDGAMADLGAKESKTPRIAGIGDPTGSAGPGPVKAEPKCAKCGSTRQVRWTGYWKDIGHGITKLVHELLCVACQGDPDWPERGRAA